MSGGFGVTVVTGIVGLGCVVSFKFVGVDGCVALMSFSAVASSWLMARPCSFFSIVYGILFTVV